MTSLVELSNGDTSFTLPTPTVAGVVRLLETVIVNASSVLDKTSCTPSYPADVTRVISTCSPTSDHEALWFQQLQ